MKIKFFFFISVFFLFSLPSYGTVRDYFADFYSYYLQKRCVCENDREILNLLNEIEQNKIDDIENFLQNSTTEEERRYAISLINEEYYDFFENLNFETAYVCCIPLKRKYQRKLKRTHKKYMRSLEKCYLS